MPVAESVIGTLIKISPNFNIPWKAVGENRLSFCFGNDKRQLIIVWTKVFNINVVNTKRNMCNCDGWSVAEIRSWFRIEFIYCKKNIILHYHMICGFLQFLIDFFFHSIELYVSVTYLLMFKVAQYLKNF